MLTHCILLSPAPSSCLILGPVCLVHMSNFRHQGIIWVWIRQQGANGEQHLKKEIETLPTHLKNSNSPTETATIHNSLQWEAF